MQHWNTMLTLAGISAAVAANVLLAGQWAGWSHSAWADCPNYAFGQAWYPEPPLPVIFLPGIIAALGILFFGLRFSASNRNKQTWQPFLSRIGLALNCLPLLAAGILPTLSDLLHLSKAGC